MWAIAACRFIGCRLIPRKRSAPGARRSGVSRLSFELHRATCRSVFLRKTTIRLVTSLAVQKIIEYFFKLFLTLHSCLLKNPALWQVHSWILARGSLWVVTIAATLLVAITTSRLLTFFFVCQSSEYLCRWRNAWKGIVWLKLISFTSGFIIWNFGNKSSDPVAFNGSLEIIWGTSNFPRILSISPWSHVRFASKHSNEMKRIILVS